MEWGFGVRPTSSESVKFLCQDLKSCVPLGLGHSRCSKNTCFPYIDQMGLGELTRELMGNTQRMFVE